MSNVIKLADYKARKELSPERTPLYLSHLRGTLSGSPRANRPQADDFGDRLTRIRRSLKRVQELMNQLKEDK